eukprot:430114_1
MTLKRAFVGIVWLTTFLSVKSATSGKSTVTQDGKYFITSTINVNVKDTQLLRSTWARDAVYGKIRLSGGECGNITKTAMIKRGIFTITAIPICGYEDIHVSLLDNNEQTVSSSSDQVGKRSHQDRSITRHAGHLNIDSKVKRMALLSEDSEESKTVETRHEKSYRSITRHVGYVRHLNIASRVKRMPLLSEDSEESKTGRLISRKSVFKRRPMPLLSDDSEDYNTDSRPEGYKLSEKNNKLALFEFLCNANSDHEPTSAESDGTVNELLDYRPESYELSENNNDGRKKPILFDIPYNLGSEHEQTSSESDHDVNLNELLGSVLRDEHIYGDISSFSSRQRTIYEDSYPT